MALDKVMLRSTLMGEEIYLISTPDRKAEERVFIRSELHYREGIAYQERRDFVFVLRAGRTRTKKADEKRRIALCCEVWKGIACAACKIHTYFIILERRERYYKYLRHRIRRRAKRESKNRLQRFSMPPQHAFHVRQLILGPNNVTDEECEG